MEPGRLLREIEDCKALLTTATSRDERMLILQQMSHWVAMLHRTQDAPPIPAPLAPTPSSMPSSNPVPAPVSLSAPKPIQTVSSPIDNAVEAHVLPPVPTPVFAQPLTEEFELVDLPSPPEDPQDLASELLYSLASRTRKAVSDEEGEVRRSRARRLDLVLDDDGDHDSDESYVDGSDESKDWQQRRRKIQRTVTHNDETLWQTEPEQLQQSPTLLAAKCEELLAVQEERLRPRVAIKWLRTLQHFASVPGTRERLGSEQLVARMVHFLGTAHSEEARSLALSVLRELSMDEGLEARLCAAPTLSALLDQLKGDSEQRKAMVACILRNICCDAQCCEKVFRAGGAALLLPIVRDGTKQLRDAVGALGYLLDRPEVDPELRLSLLQWLGQWLERGEEEVRAAAAEGLQLLLARAPRCWREPALQLPGLFDLLLNSVYEPRSVLCLHCLRLLLELVRGEEQALQSLLPPLRLTSLTKLISSSPSMPSEARFFAAQILWRVLQLNCADRQLVRSIFPAFSQLLKSDVQRDKQLAAGFISDLALDVSLRPMLEQSGVYCVLVQSLRDPDASEALLLNLLLALDRIAQSHEACLRREGVDYVLLSLASGAESRLRRAIRKVQRTLAASSS